MTNEQTILDRLARVEAMLESVGLSLSSDEFVSKSDLRRIVLLRAYDVMGLHATVNDEMAAARLGISVLAYKRGRFGTEKIKKISGGELGTLKREIEKFITKNNRLVSDLSAEYRANARPVKKRKSILARSK